MSIHLIEGVNIILQLVVVAMILLSQGIVLFVFAKKRRKKAWLWGILGLIQFPMPSILYYFIVVRPSKKNKMTKY